MRNYAFVSRCPQCGQDSLSGGAGNDTYLLAYNGGRVSIRWGADGGVDFDAPALNGGYEGADLLSGGLSANFGEESTVEVGWRGYRLGAGNMRRGKVKA